MAKRVADHERPEYRLFAAFAQRVWRHLNLPPLTAVQVDIAHYLQFGPPRRMVEAFRGVGKSWLTAAFVVWLLYCDPQKKIVIVSASKDYADTMSVFIKRLIDELPECAFLKPKGNQRNSTVIFDVGPAMADKSPSVKSVGISGQITGSRADVIVADDVEVPKNSFTATMREHLAEQVKEFAYVLKPGDVDGVPLPLEKQPSIIYLGTPQTEMSLYNQLPLRGYDVRIWPARIPEKIAQYHNRLAPFVMKMIEKGAKAGALVDPKRFSKEDLLKRRADVGATAFHLQFMLDTSLNDALKFPLKLANFIVMGLDGEMAPVNMAWAMDPRTVCNDLQAVGFNGDLWHSPAFVDDASWVPFQGSVMAIDPSGKGKDETAYAVVKMLHGRLFLVASGGFLGGYEMETLQGLADVAKKHKVNSIVLEQNFGGGMFGALLRPVLASTWPCSVEETHATGAKEERIIGTLEPVLDQHRLVVDRSVILADLEVQEVVYSLFYQLTRITKDRGSLEHDDRLDALEMAVKYWMAQLEVDADKVAEESKEALMDQMLEDFLDGLGESLGEAGSSNARSSSNAPRHLQDGSENSPGGRMRPSWARRAV